MQQGSLDIVLKVLNVCVCVCGCAFLEAVNLCLYGLPNGSWQVRLPSEELPPNFPEPLLGINFPRDGMQEKDWLTLLAAHSDSWLISMAFHLGSLRYFDQDKRYMFLLAPFVVLIFHDIDSSCSRFQEEKFLLF